LTFVRVKRLKCVCNRLNAGDLAGLLFRGDTSTLYTGIPSSADMGPCLLAESNPSTYGTNLIKSILDVHNLHTIESNPYEI